MAPSSSEIARDRRLGRLEAVGRQEVDELLLGAHRVMLEEHADAVLTLGLTEHQVAPA